MSSQNRPKFSLSFFCSFHEFMLSQNFSRHCLVCSIHTHPPEFRHVVVSKLMQIFWYEDSAFAQHEQHTWRQSNVRPQRILKFNIESSHSFFRGNNSISFSTHILLIFKLKQVQYILECYSFAFVQNEYLQTGKKNKPHYLMPLML